MKLVSRCGEMLLLDLRTTKDVVFLSIKVEIETINLLNDTLVRVTLRFRVLFCLVHLPEE